MKRFLPILYPPSPFYIVFASFFFIGVFLQVIVSFFNLCTRWKRFAFKTLSLAKVSSLNSDNNKILPKRINNLPTSFKFH